MCCSMRVLFALFLLLASICCHPPEKDSFLVIFTNDGTFYKYHIAHHSTKVDWFGSLKYKLISFDFQPQTLDITHQNSTYFIPTIDGNFLYIHRNKQIVVHRKQVEELLNVCFVGTKSKTSSQNFHQQNSQYFVYEKYQYYILNLHNGDLKDLEQFLQEKINFKAEKYAILKISKKYLKQLTSQLEIKWSAISSTVDLVPAELFLKDPHVSSEQNSAELNKSIFQFRRIGNKQIELLNTVSNEAFEIGGNSPILAIFSYLDEKVGFLNHPIKYFEKQKLAIEFKSGTQQTFHMKDFISSKEDLAGELAFPHSEQFHQKAKPSHSKMTQLQFCINSFRTMKSILEMDAETTMRKGRRKEELHVNLHEKHMNQSLGDRQGIQLPLYDFESHVIHIEAAPTKDQPYIWLFMIGSIISISYAMYKVKINSLLNQLSTIETQNDQKFNQIRQQLGKLEEMQRMYEVYWDKLIYSSTQSQQFNPQNSYEYLIFAGKFLNQETMVYAIKTQHADVVNMQHELNLLLNCSHKSLCKLYYYTKNSQYLLIFTEKLTPISEVNVKELFSNDLKYGITEQKQLIIEIMDTIKYLDNKMEIYSLPFQAVILTKPKDQHLPLQIRINAIPSILRKPHYDQTDSDDNHSNSTDSNTLGDLRIHLVSVFHWIITKGHPFDIKSFQLQVKNDTFILPEHLEFFYFLLKEAKIKDLDNISLVDVNTSPQNKNFFFSEIMGHPFLWDSKRKMLFLCDFSNYIETYIDELKVRKLESCAHDYSVIPTPWIKEFHPQFVTVSFMKAREINNYRKYDFDSVRDLIRVIRNKINHFHEIPREIRAIIGKTPEQFVEYCLDLFPNLLQFTYVYTIKKKWKLHMK